MPNEAPYECIECGAPEWGPLPVHHGCRVCGGQGEIVPRGTRQKIRERPGDIKTTIANGMVLFSIDDVVFGRRRTTNS